mgnify:CR=1 FL=1
MIEQSNSGEDEILTRSDVYGGTYETEQSAPLVDPVQGKLTVLRRFDFELPPMPKALRPTKDKLLGMNKSKLLAFLWKDELEPIEDFKIKIARNYKRFRIFVKCQAKKGSLIFTKPLVLQEVLNEHKRNLV